jgi:predicted PurR-regulated permease PerM
MRKLTIERVFRGLLSLVFLAVILLILYRFSTLFVYLVTALIFSYLFDPVVNRMQVAGFKRINAVMLVVMSFILLLIWASTSILPAIGSQVITLASQFNISTILQIVEQIEAQLLVHIPFLTEGLFRNSVENIAGRVFDFDNFEQTVTNLFGLFANIAAAALIIPFATFFFLKDGSKLRRQVLQLVPNKFFETTLTIINKVETRLIYYFRGVLIQCTLVGIISWLLLSLVGLNNALAVGVAVGLANTIPYFGPVIGYILSITIAIFETGDLSLVLFSIGAIGIAQIIDNIILQPLIFSRSADMHPLYILFIVLIGAEIAGPIGMLVAIPLATIIRIVVTEINWSINNYHVFKSEN